MSLEFSQHYVWKTKLLHCRRETAGYSSCFILLFSSTCQSFLFIFVRTPHVGCILSEIGKDEWFFATAEFNFLFLVVNSCDRAGEERPTSVTQSQGCITSMCEVEHPQIQPAAMSCTWKLSVISKGKPKFIEKKLQSSSVKLFMSIFWIAEKCLIEWLLLSGSLESWESCSGATQESRCPCDAAL